MQVRPVRTEVSPIALVLECGDLWGWIDDCDAALLIATGRGTVMARSKGDIRRVRYLASVDAPFIEESEKRQAFRSYAGQKALNTVYREDVNTGTRPGHVAPIHMLKKALSDGSFARW
jgi:hypothetical protein